MRMKDNIIFSYKITCETVYIKNINKVEQNCYGLQHVNTSPPPPPSNPNIETNKRTIKSKKSNKSINKQVQKVFRSHTIVTFNEDECH